MAEELRWRAVAIADAQNVPVGSSWYSRWFFRSRAEFAARGVFETGRWPDPHPSSWIRPSAAVFSTMTPAEVSLAFGSLAASSASSVATDGFGALQITTDGSSGHSDYFEAGSLTNLARIVQSLYADVDLVD
jgi:hypothetical protein